MRSVNATLHRASLARIGPDGVTTTEGVFVPADVTTGFDLEFPRPTSGGREGRKLADLRKNGDDPRAYLGRQLSGFPNLFVTAGPNAAPNHVAGQNITSEGHVHYMVECLQYLVENGYASMDVAPEDLEEYNQSCWVRSHRPHGARTTVTC